MRWLVVLALAACGTSMPPVTKLDRSCTSDADCIADDACCAGCGDRVGEPVDYKAWQATSAAREARCKKQACPDIASAEPPACREEHRAVCTAARCERLTTKTAACGEQKL